MRGRHASSESGFVLLATLWLVVLVVGVTGTMLLSLRTARLQVRNAVTATVARQEASSGLVRAISVLERSFSANETGDRGAAGAAARLSSAQADLARLGRVAAPGGGTYELTVVDESARFPINRASEADLQRLLIGIGRGHLEAVEVAAALADWMDPDGLHRLHGAEWDDYYAGIPGAQRPSNGPFVTMGELRFVRGVDGDLYDELAEILTVAPDARVNLNSAWEAVISALPGLDRRAARQIIAVRRTGQVLESLEQVTGILDAPGRERLQAHYAEFRTSITFVPAVYRVISVGTPPGHGHPVRLDAQVAVNGSRVSVIRVTERRWP
jgi:general secretion pathway protein K